MCQSYAFRMRYLHKAVHELRMRKVLVDVGRPGSPVIADLVEETQRPRCHLMFLVAVRADHYVLACAERICAERICLPTSLAEV